MEAAAGSLDPTFLKTEAPLAGGLAAKPTDAPQGEAPICWLKPKNKFEFKQWKMK